MSLVNEMFARVKFDSQDVAIHQSAYDAVVQIAHVMEDTAPLCGERTLALRALHLALMHFGTALAKHEKYQTS